MRRNCRAQRRQETMQPSRLQSVRWLHRNLIENNYSFLYLILCTERSTSPYTIYIYIEYKPAPSSQIRWLGQRDFSRQRPLLKRSSLRTLLPFDPFNSPSPLCKNESWCTRGKRTRFRVFLFWVVLECDFILAYFFALHRERWKVNFVAYKILHFIINAFF